MKNKWHILVIAGFGVLVALGVLILLNPFDITSWNNTGYSGEKIDWATEPDTGYQDNTTSGVADADVYTLPIGGFDYSDIFTVSNTSHDLNYTFHSRSWGPGQVKYELDPIRNCNGAVSNDTVRVRVEPMEFTAEPHHSYISRVHIETGPAFETTLDKCGPGAHGGYNRAYVAIGMNVTLEDRSKHLGNDSLFLNTPLMESPGYSTGASDYFHIEKSSIEMNPGETVLLNMSFHRGLNGFGKISYVVSKTPLNVTVAPVTFLANLLSNPYPGVMKIHADRNLSSGTYPFYLKIDGGEGQFLYPGGGEVPFGDKTYNPELSSVVIFTVHITAPESAMRPNSNEHE